MRVTVRVTVPSHVYICTSTCIWMVFLEELYNICRHVLSNFMGNFAHS